MLASGRKLARCKRHDSFMSLGLLRRALVWRRASDDCRAAGSQLGAELIAVIPIEQPARHARGCLGRLIVYGLLADGRHVRRVDLNAPWLKRFGKFPLEVYDQQAVVHRSTGHDYVVGEIQHPSGKTVARSPGAGRCSRSCP